MHDPNSINEQNKPLFSFGTLMDIDVLSSVTNLSKEKLTIEPASLTGYRQRIVTGEDFPVIVASEGSTTQGVVIDGLDTEAVERILFYEGDEYYLASCIIRRYKNTECDAGVFLSRGIYSTGSEMWNFEHWQRNEKTEFLSRVRNYMKYFGRLSATDADKYW